MQVRLPLLKPPAELVPQGSEAGPLLQVGDLARECGKTVRAIHLYEELGPAMVERFFDLIVGVFVTALITSNRTVSPVANRRNPSA